MKRFIAVLLLHIFLMTTPVQADWRWSKPHFKPHKIVYFCDTSQCIKSSRVHAYAYHQAAVASYNHHKEHEWSHWTSLYIPSCTWYGESGTGPEYDPYRYTLPNSQGSGALGKFQFMPGTYRANAKYFDWSALDQEIAARREYGKHGTNPWANC